MKPAGSFDPALPRRPMTASPPSTPQRIVVLDASPAGSGVSARVAALLVENGAFRVVAHLRQSGHDGIGALPVMLADCLSGAGWKKPDLVATIIGPGSFTGLRTSCALAAGLAFGADCPVVGVTRGEALAPRLKAQVVQNGLTGWLHVTLARRGRWFVEAAPVAVDVPGSVKAVLSAEWLPDAGTWLIAGDAAADLVAASEGERLRLAPWLEARPEDIAAVALARLAGVLPPRPALPLYVDPPEAKLPRDGLRATPQ